MSDVAAAAWSVAAILCALRSRRVDAWALAAGAAFGMAVLVRPTDILLAAPLALALSWRPRTAALLVAGGLPFAVILALWNRAAFGGALATGYSGQLASELALANFSPRLLHYGYWTVAQLSPLVVIGWLAAPFAKYANRRDATMLVCWFGGFFVFYCFWGPSDAWWYTRYLIPALPALILGFLLALRALSLPRRSFVIAAALLVVAAFEWQTDRRQRPLEVGPGQSTFRDASLAVESRAAGNALVVSMEFSGAIRFHTRLSPLRWDFLTPEEFGVVRTRAAEKGWPIFAVLLPHEVEKAALHVPGEWKFLENVGRASLWELPPP
jgi:4-amino-4-deoxy-L-arabinose transferase-like glycosyltransferase